MPPPPLLCMKIFDKRIFLKQQSVFQWNISVQWDKNFDGKSWYSPPPYPNIFYTRNYCNSKGFPYGIFRHCETKIFRRKILILPPPPLIQTFSVPGISETLKGSFPYEIFRHCETKDFWQKMLKLPPPPPTPLIHKLFRYRKFSETQHRRVHLPSFSALWDKKISTENRKSWHNPLKLKIFRYPKIMKH